MPLIIHCQSEEEFIEAALNEIQKIITDAINQRGKCVIALSGGSTPGPIYTLLGKIEHIQWSKVLFALADERYVSENSDDSNKKLLLQTLLRGNVIAASQIISPNTTLPLDTSIREYADTVKKTLAGKPFDLIVLGMGEDGHTASLFPPVPGYAFGNDTVIHTQTDRFAVRDRISLTHPLIASARNQILLLKGTAKIDVLKEMMESPQDEHRWPLQPIVSSGKCTVITAN